MRLPLLTFHSVDSSASVISCSPEALRDLMARLASAGWRGTSLSDALAAPREPRRVGIAFDDGYRNVLDEALPVLDEFGFTATVFIVTGHVGGRSDWSAAGREVPVLPLLDWPGIEHLAASGWEIGSHGVRHLCIPAAAADELRSEVEDSARQIESRIGTRPELFAYPYGDTSPAVCAAVRDVYVRSVGTRLDFVRIDDLGDPHDLPRLDTYYLQGVARKWHLDGRSMASYVALRRVLRSLRRTAAHRL